MLFRLWLRSAHLSHLLSVRRGVNLLEVVVASFILSTCLVLAIGIWATYHKSLTKSKNMLVGTSLGRSLIEQHLANGYAALTPILGAPQTVTVMSRSQVRGRLSEVPFTATVLANDTSSPGTRKITVELYWPDVAGQRNLHYETFVFRTQ